MRGWGDDTLLTLMRLPNCPIFSCSRCCSRPTRSASWLPQHRALWRTQRRSAAAGRGGRSARRARPRATRFSGPRWSRPWRPRGRERETKLRDVEAQVRTPCCRAPYSGLRAAVGVVAGLAPLFVPWAGTAQCWGNWQQHLLPVPAVAPLVRCSFLGLPEIALPDSPASLSVALSGARRQCPSSSRWHA